MKLASTALTTLGATAALIAATVAPASAAPQFHEAPMAPEAPPSTQVRETGYFYNTSYTDVYLPNPAKRFYGNGGGVLSFSTADSSTVSGSLSATSSADAGVVFAKVSASVGVTVGASATATTTVGYTWNVPAGQTGWIEMGARGYQIDYTKSHYASPCTEVIDQVDTITGATSNAWFTHS